MSATAELSAPSMSLEFPSSFWIGPSFRIRRLGRHDLIGIDNRRAGHVITEHLLRLGCRRVLFVGPKDAASTVDEREAGYREALLRGLVCSSIAP